MRANARGCIFHADSGLRRAARHRQKKHCGGGDAWDLKFVIRHRRSLSLYQINEQPPARLTLPEQSRETTPDCVFSTGLDRALAPDNRAEKQPQARYDDDRISNLA